MRPHEVVGPVPSSDLWQLGPHRVMCGDATRMADVGRLFGPDQWRLLATSPPYLDKRDYAATIPDWQHLALRFMEQAMLHTLPASDCLVNLGLIHENRRVVRYWEPWLTACEARGWPLFGWYVWDKLSGFPGDYAGRLAPAHEWLFHFQHGVTTANAWVPTRTAHVGKHKPHSSRRNPDGSMEPWHSPGRATKVPDSVIRAPRHVARSNTNHLLHNHPAVQAQELVACLLLTWTALGDLVYDPFGGSGQTLMTAHALGRRCYTMDIAPAYVAGMLDRWTAMTGEAPVLCT